MKSVFSVNWKELEEKAVEGDGVMIVAPFVIYLIIHFF